MYSSTAGTGVRLAERGRSRRAANRTPSAIGIQTGSRTSNSSGIFSRMVGPWFTPRPSQMISWYPVVETPAEAALATGIGIHIGAEYEMGPIAAHMYLRLEPRVPIRPPVMNADGNHCLRRARIVARDHEFLDLAIGNHGADFFDAIRTVASAVAHRCSVGGDIVESLALLDSGIEDRDSRGRRLFDPLEAGIFTHARRRQHRDGNLAGAGFDRQRGGLGRRPGERPVAAGDRDAQALAGRKDMGRMGECDLDPIFPARLQRRRLGMAVPVG